MFISIIRHLAGMCLIWQLAKSCSFGSQWYWIWQKAKHRGKRYFQITIFTSKIQDQKSHLQNENLDCASLPFFLDGKPRHPPFTFTSQRLAGGGGYFLWPKKEFPTWRTSVLHTCKVWSSRPPNIPLCHHPTPQQVFFNSTSSLRWNIPHYILHNALHK